MDQINKDLGDTSVVLVLAPTTPSTPPPPRTPSSPIAGMPVLRVWEAENVIVFKRTLAAGYAGVQNPLFYRDNSQMIFGNGKQRVEDILRAF